jgi:glycosyltransferase involved in cell wall biosynthesis
VTRLPAVSIVICTYRRPELLRLVLESIAAQENVPSGAFEVIVVDNERHPNLEVQAAVNEFTTRLPLHYIQEPEVGLSYARNTGGKAAQANYIGYIDDDVKVSEKYISELIWIINQYSPDICGGPYYPFYLDPKPIWFKDAYGTNSISDSMRSLSKLEYLTGMNIIFHRDVLEDVGWFYPNLGMAGKKVWYGEETMVQIKAWNSHPTLKVLYDPELYIYHLVPTRKMSVRNRLKTVYLMGRSQAYFWLSESDQINARHHAIIVLIQLSFALIAKTIPRILGRDRQAYPFWQNYVYEKTSHYFGMLGSQVTFLMDLF